VAPAVVALARWAVDAMAFSRQVLGARPRVHGLCRYRAPAEGGGRPTRVVASMSVSPRTHGVGSSSLPSQQSAIGPRSVLAPSLNGERPETLGFGVAGKPRSTLPSQVVGSVLSMNSIGIHR
jgi:hypothetical protein